MRSWTNLTTPKSWTPNMRRYIDLVLVFYCISQVTTLSANTPYERCRNPCQSQLKTPLHVCDICVCIYWDVLRTVFFSPTKVTMDFSTTHLRTTHWKSFLTVIGRNIVQVENQFLQDSYFYLEICCNQVHALKRQLPYHQPKLRHMQLPAHVVMVYFWNTA